MFQKLNNQIAEWERLKSEVDTSRSDAEIRLFQIDCQIRSAQREIAALDAYENKGQAVWPNEKGTRQT